MMRFFAGLLALFAIGSGFKAISGDSIVSAIMSAMGLIIATQIVLTMEIINAIREQKQSAPEVETEEEEVRA